MTDDIVARLRFYNMQFGRSCRPGARTIVEPEFMAQLCDDWKTAADEIERMRARVAELEAERTPAP